MAFFAAEGQCKMSNNTTFTFEIEGVDLEDLSVVRLAQYAEALAQLLRIDPKDVYLRSMKTKGDDGRTPSIELPTETNGEM